MEGKAQIIYKSYMTYFPTCLPVYFYGMPNGKVYCVYARYHEINPDKSGLEFVFAVHEDFTYDYELSNLVYKNFKKVNLSEFVDIVDKPDQRIKTVNIYRDIHSYAAAQDFLNTQAKSMVQSNVLDLVYSQEIFCL